MNSPTPRWAKLLAGLAFVLCIVAASIWYLQVQPPKTRSVAPPAQAHAPSDHLRLPSTPTDPSLATSPAAPSGTPTLPPVKKLYSAIGASTGTPLPKLPMPVRVGAEKGRVLEVEKLSAQTLSDLSPGQSIALPTPDGEMTAVVNLIQRDDNGWVRIGGDLPDKSGTFTLASNSISAGGLIMMPSKARAFEFLTEPNGRSLVVERRLADVHCFGLPAATAKRGVAQALATGDGGTPAEAPPLLSSRPSAPAVVYIDFDGETVTDPAWDGGRTIVAPAATLTAAEMTEVYNRVREDYAPFNIDITTSLARYNAVPANRRTRCIVTSNDIAARGAGGVAYVNAFSTAGTTYSATIPCWVFNDGVVGIAEAISHEVGHTLGLDHDGRISPAEEYYAGAGTGATGWAPIMGVGYDQLLVQWSKGEYKSANNKQDDLAIISKTANGFGYITDEAGATLTAAATLNVSGTTISQSGVIAFNDVDIYRFTAAAGNLSVTANPATISPNLDIKLELLNSTGTVLVASNPLTTLPASISSTLTAGTYYLRISGTGKGDVLVDGYTSYGSIGAYTLTGTVTTSNEAQPPTITSSDQATGQVGSAFSYQISASNTPTSYAVTGTLPSGLSLNTTTGLISGTPTLATTSSVTISATNGQGTGTLSLTITISPAVASLASAIDINTPIPTTSGNLPWIAQTSVTYDGVDAAASGRIGNSQSSSLLLDVTGPVTLEFRWKVDSEANYDKFTYLIDGVAKESISGLTDWALVSIAIPSGNHRVEWRYAKDSSVSSGSDTAWLDTVALRAPIALRLSGDLSFGKVSVGSTSTKTFTIFNDGATAINVSSISYPTGFSGALTGQVAAGGSRSVTVTFAPVAEITYSGNLTVNSDAASGVNTLAISGEGTASTPTLTSGVPVSSLSGASKSQRTYKVVVPSGTTSLTLTTTGGTGDVDIYLKRGSAPTTSIFDLKSDGNTTEESIVATNPIAGDWYVLLDAYSAYSDVTIEAVLASGSSYTITASALGSGSVTGGGTYNSGSLATLIATPSGGASFQNWTENNVVISSSATYSFTVSSSRTLVANFTGSSGLTSNVPVTGLAGSAATELLYRITVPSNTASLTVSTSGGTGDADLYVKYGSRPTTTSFTRSSEGTTTSERISISRPIAGDWYIVVRGYTTFSGVSLNAVLVSSSSSGSTTNTDSFLLTLKEMAGAYRGLIGVGSPTQPLLGSATFTLSPTGIFTCRATIQGKLLSFRGRFDENGLFSTVLVRNKVQIPVSLALDLEGQSYISGTLKWEDEEAEILVTRSITNAAAYAGLYVLDLPADATQTDNSYPQSSGLLILVVNKNGRVTIQAMLGDSTQFITTGFLARDGSLAISRTLYGKLGYFGGWLQFDSDTASVEGTLRWHKPARPEDTLFPDGFDGTTTVSGSRQEF